MLTALLTLIACSTDPAYIVEGTVVKVSAADEVILDHEDIPGFMDAMTMPFRVRDPGLLTGLEPGHQVVARLEIDESGGHLAKIRITGKGAIPAYEEPGGAAPLRVGQVLPRTEVHLSDGTTTLVGEGQSKATALTFLYTRCPMPEYCPATVARYQALQAAVGPDVRLLAITLDPEYDTDAVLGPFAEQSAADPAIWGFGRVEGLEDLAMYAGLSVIRKEGSAEILHGNRMLVLDPAGKVVQRYDDLTWPIERVVTQLRTGEPLGL